MIKRKTLRRDANASSLMLDGKGGVRIRELSEGVSETRPSSASHVDSRDLLIPSSWRFSVFGQTKSGFLIASSVLKSA